MTNSSSRSCNLAERRAVSVFTLIAFAQYQAIVDWASRSRDAGERLPLPKEFRQHALHPFR